MGSCNRALPYRSFHSATCMRGAKVDSMTSSVSQAYQARVSWIGDLDRMRDLTNSFIVTIVELGCSGLCVLMVEGAGMGFGLDLS